MEKGADLFLTLTAHGPSPPFTTDALKTNGEAWRELHLQRSVHKAPPPLP